VDTKTIQSLEQQLKALSQDFRRLRVALNALHGFASLNAVASEESVSFARRELQDATAAFHTHFQLFAQTAGNAPQQSE
jgi:hypothetical protein